MDILNVMNPVFNVTTGTIAITDPCYNPPEHTYPAVDGEWELTREDNGDLIAINKKFKFSNGWAGFSTKTIESSVDSGQVAVFDASIVVDGKFPYDEDVPEYDKSLYHKICDVTLGDSPLSIECKSDKHYEMRYHHGVVENVACASTIYGDGGYSTTLSFQDGKVYKVHFDFAEENEEEYDEEYDEENEEDY